MLWTYRIPVDDGAAPNPYWGVASLTVCKPRIRQNAAEGHWVLALGASKAADGRNHAGTLVCALQVDEVLPLAAYWRDHPEKRPDLGSSDWRRWLGDNFYEPLGGDRFRAHPGVHWDTDLQDVIPLQRGRDLRGRHALLSRRFLYFGSAPLVIDPGVFARIDHPYVGQAHGRKPWEEAERIAVEWLESLPPHLWNEPQADPQFWPYEGLRPVGSDGGTRQPGHARTPRGTPCRACGPVPARLLSPHAARHRHH